MYNCSQVNQSPYKDLEKDRAYNKNENKIKDINANVKGIRVKLAKTKS
jgi:hypothetical protein